eukprot:3372082-Rhodomonas_salina.2
MNQMGLMNCADTKCGNQFLQGLSGTTPTHSLCARCAMSGPDFANAAARWPEAPSFPRALAHQVAAHAVPGRAYKRARRGRGRVDHVVHEGAGGENGHHHLLHDPPALEQGVRGLRRDDGAQRRARRVLRACGRGCVVLHVDRTADAGQCEPGRVSAGPGQRGVLGEGGGAEGAGGVGGERHGELRCQEARAACQGQVRDLEARSDLQPRPPPLRPRHPRSDALSRVPKPVLARARCRLDLRLLRLDLRLLRPDALVCLVVGDGVQTCSNLPLLLLLLRAHLRRSTRAHAGAGAASLTHCQLNCNLPRSQCTLFQRRGCLSLISPADRPCSVPTSDREKVCVSVSAYTR